jgi:tetratricopeptide (TPR) repeat protein
MEALLAELGRDPSATRRRALVAGLALLALASAGAAIWQASRKQGLLCRGAEGRLAGVWDAERRGLAEKAFAASGRPFAADAFLRASRIVDAQVAMRTEACEATRLRGEQGEEALGLRMACLDGRLEELRGLAGAFAAADGEAVGRAVKSAQALSPLAECADLRALSAPVRLPADPVVKERIASVRTELARSRGLADGARYPDALASVRPATVAAREIGWRPLEAEAFYALGELLAVTADQPGADKALSQALWAAEAGRHELVAARASVRHAFLLQGMAKIGAADAEMPLARALVERLGPQPAVQAQLADLEGVLHERHGALKESIQDRERALAIAEKHFGPESLETARYRTNLGSGLQAVGDLDGALAHYRAALAITEKAVGPNHPEVAHALSGVAAVLVNAGRWGEAREPCQRALAVNEAALGPSHPATAKARLSLGTALSIPSSCREGRPELEQGHRDLVAALGPDHPTVGDALMYLGNCDRSTRHPDKAMERFREAQRIFEKKLGPNHPWLVSPIGTIGELEYEAGRFKAALPLLERAVKLGEANPESPSELADMQYYLGDTLWRLGDRKRGVAFGKKSRAGWAALGSEPEVVANVARLDEWLRTHR